MNTIDGCSTSPSAAVAEKLYAAGVITEDEVIPWILGTADREPESESVADRAERLAARHTRYDGSPR